jgi:hypothetical protein
MTGGAASLRLLQRLLTATALSATSAIGDGLLTDTAD